MPQQSYKASSSSMSSFMCCTSERYSKPMAYQESQGRFLWLDPTRWVEKRSKKEQVSKKQLKKPGVIRLFQYWNVYYAKALGVAHEFS